MDTSSNPHNFVLMGGNTGVLILSQSATRFEMASELAHSLHDQGNTVAVSAPLHHIENWGDLKEHEWPMWLEEACQLLTSMRETCNVIFLAGLSMGAPLALKIAQLYTNDIDGIVIVEPSFPNIRRTQRSLWAQIRGELGKIVQPLVQLYFSQISKETQVNAGIIADNISSPFIREIVLERSSEEMNLVVEECATFIREVREGQWLSDIADDNDLDDSDLINAEFSSIVEGLSLDESAPTTYLDQLEYVERQERLERLERLDRLEDIEHFNAPNPALAPIADPRKRRAIIAMILGPIYTLVAGVTYFDPLGIEPWPGILTFIGGLAYFFYALRDTPTDDDGAIL